MATIERKSTYVVTLDGGEAAYLCDLLDKATDAGEGAGVLALDLFEMFGTRDDD